jgi:hypothetical protein
LAQVAQQATRAGFGRSAPTGLPSPHPSCPRLLGHDQCSDGVQNGDETGVDCGGSCTVCPVDCVSSETTCTCTPACDNTCDCTDTITITTPAAGRGQACPSATVRTFTGAACPNQSTIRLDASGNGVDTGRIEVKVNGIWGTVCDDRFTNNGAMVACKAMGFADGGVMHPAWSGPDFPWRTYVAGWSTPFSTSPINMGWAGCTGSETSLFDCPGAKQVAPGGNDSPFCLNGFDNTPSDPQVRASQTTGPCPLGIGCRHNEDVAVCCGSAYVTGGATCAR